MDKFNVIAAARSDSELLIASKSKVDIIFMLSPNISDIKKQTELVHSRGKKIFIHLDLAEGIGKDEYGIRFAKEQGVDGIISTRGQMIKFAREAGLLTVQRFFALDTKGLDSIHELLESSAPDLIEIMPGVIGKVISRIATGDIPVIAGGLVETKQEVTTALSSGAVAISTGKADLWYM